MESDPFHANEKRRQTPHSKTLRGQPGAHKTPPGLGVRRAQRRFSFRLWQRRPNIHLAGFSSRRLLRLFWRALEALVK